MIRVRSVAPMDGYRLRVGFTDGVEKVVDVTRYLRGPVFEPLKRDRSAFEAVSVDPELGTVVWPNGADIDPDVLYGRFEPSWAEESATGGAELSRAPGTGHGRVAEPRPEPPYRPGG